MAKLKNARLTAKQAGEHLGCTPLDLFRLVLHHGLPVEFDGHRYPTALPAADLRGEDPLTGEECPPEWDAGGTPDHVAAAVFYPYADPLRARLWFYRDELDAFVTGHPELFQAGAPPTAATVQEAGRKGGKSAHKVDPQRVEELLEFLRKWVAKRLGAPTCTLGRWEEASDKEFGDLPRTFRRSVARPFIYPPGEKKPGRKPRAK